MANAASWIALLLTGTAATIVATIAVAAIGFMLLVGRIDFDRMLRVILGCFVVFGAGLIANGIAGFAGSSQTIEDTARAPLAPPEITAPQIEPNAIYDPYAGAAAPVSMQSGSEIDRLRP